MLFSVWIQLVGLQAVENDADAVMKVFNDGLAANPQSFDLLWAKASFLQEQNDIDGAIDIYETLYEENSSSPIIANNLASLLATFREDEENRTREADCTSPGKHRSSGFSGHVRLDLVSLRRHRRGPEISRTGRHRLT